MKRILTIFFVLVAAMLIAPSCNKADNNIAIDPDDTTQTHRDEPKFYTVQISIAASISGASFADGDALLITNPAILLTPATLAMSGGNGMATANFAGELKVKDGASLIPGVTTLTAALTNESNAETPHNHGVPLDEAIPISSIEDGVARYGYWACKDFVYNDNATSATLTLHTAFIQFELEFVGAKLLITTADKKFYRKYLQREAMFALPDGSQIESQILGVKQTLDVHSDGTNFYTISRSLPDDCIPGVFSVSGDKQVFFSRGNLQYRIYDDSWRFAPQQYHKCFADDDVVGYNYEDWMGEDNWIDLFGYGMWLEGEYPANTDQDYNAYYPPCDVDMNFEGVSAIGEEWTTLTKKEWGYMLGSDGDSDSHRNMASDLYRWSSVFGVPGFIVMPDESTVDIGWEYSDDESWAEMEAAGALFLPLAGYRFGDILYAVGTGGYYWSNTGSYEDDYSAISVYLDPDSWSATNISSSRSNAHSVRLVRD